jgi:hypothetical protein
MSKMDHDEYVSWLDETLHQFPQDMTTSQISHFIAAFTLTYGINAEDFFRLCQLAAKYRIEFLANQKNHLN